METLIQLTITGLANGAILALSALGFVIIFKATGVINFAQGYFLLVGAYLVWAGVVQFGMHWSRGGVGRPDRGRPRRVDHRAIHPAPTRRRERDLGHHGHDRPRVRVAGRGAVPLGDRTTRHARLHPPRGTIDLLGVPVSLNRVIAVVLAGAAFLVLTLFFQRSRHGIAMRAVADDQQAAMTVGISVRRVFALAWALAAISAVLAGIIVANLFGVSGEVAVFGLLVFPVVILGGLDSVPGTILAGLIIGLLMSFTAGYIGGGLQQVIPFVVLVLILLIKPYGLFGEVRIERV
jgi:branched-chain amino acid transport system permease protein